jgi:hypothetical protein
VKGSVVTMSVDDTGTRRARRIKAICIAVTRMMIHKGAELEYWLDVVRIPSGSNVDVHYSTHTDHKIIQQMLEVKTQLYYIYIYIYIADDGNS